MLVNKFCNANAASKEKLTSLSVQLIEEDCVQMAGRLLARYEGGLSLPHHPALCVPLCMWMAHTRRHEALGG